MSDDRMPPHRVVNAIETEADTLVVLRHMEYSLARREAAGVADPKARLAVARQAQEYQRISKQTQSSFGHALDAPLFTDRSPEQ